MRYARRGRGAAGTFFAIATLALAAASPALAQGPAPAFGTPTMVSPFIPGFEPDVTVDKSATAGAGQTYTSTPFGFSTSESFIFRSNDNRQSFHFTEGNALGKPTTCVGGGDSELQVDRVDGRVFFSDLQGLTNFSNSASADSGRTWTPSCTSVIGAGVDRQWIGVDNNGARNAVGAGANDGRLYEDYDNVQQNTDTTNADNELGNQLVMNESVDGVHYGSNCTVAGAPCPTPPAVITRDEGIPGNVVVDDNAGSPFQHTVYAVHTGSVNKSVIVSRCSGKAGDATAAQVANDCTDPTQVAPGDTGHVNVNWHDTAARVQGNYLTGSLFASVAVDKSGNVYVTWAEYPIDAAGKENGPGVIKLAVSTDGAKTFRGPFNVSPPTLGNNVMPWVTAGTSGRIGIAWYGAPAASENGIFGPDNLNHGTWNVFYAQSIDALGGTPHFTLTQVSDHQTKFGNISTGGFGGTPDRSLGDYLQVANGLDGQAIISFVDDTSADRNPDYCMGCGQTPAEASGPVMIATQRSGPSLDAAKGDVAGAAPPSNGVDDPTGQGYPDAFLSFAGQDINATPNLDIKHVDVSTPDSSHVAITMTTADPSLQSDLATNPTLGGPVGEWIVRWAAPTYDKPGDGNIFYVGMQAGSGGAPQFYTGSTCAIGTTHTKYFTYPTTAAVPGTISGATIRWTVPLTAIGSPALGQGMFSVTGFTSTQGVPSGSAGATGCGGNLITGGGAAGIPNVIDLSAPFTYGVGGTLINGGGARSGSTTSGAAAGKRMRLTVSPSSTVTGCRSFRFRTTSRVGGRVRAVRGAVVHFAGHKGKPTDRRGYTRFRACLRHVRHYRARARKSGYRDALASVAAQRRHRPAATFTG